MIAATLAGVAEQRNSSDRTAGSQEILRLPLPAIAVVTVCRPHRSGRTGSGGQALTPRSFNRSARHRIALVTHPDRQVDRPDRAAKLCRRLVENGHVPGRLARRHGALLGRLQHDRLRGSFRSDATIPQYNEPNPVQVGPVLVEVLHLVWRLNGRFQQGNWVSAGPLRGPPERTISPTGRASNSKHSRMGLDAGLLRIVYIRILTSQQVLRLLQENCKVRLSGEWACSEAVG